MSNGPTTRSGRKRSRMPEINAGNDPRPPDNSRQKIVQEDSENIFCKENMFTGDTQQSKQVLNRLIHCKKWIYLTIVADHLWHAFSHHAAEGLVEIWVCVNLFFQCSCIILCTFSDMIDSTDDRSTSNCLFQALIQHTLGLQFSIVTEVAEVCISALHESSGNYSITIWNFYFCIHQVAVLFLSPWIIIFFKYHVAQWLRISLGLFVYMDLWKT